MIPSATLSPIDPKSEQLRGLTAISRALTYATTLDQVARLTVERGAGLLGAKAALLLMPDAGEDLHVRAAHDVGEPIVAGFEARGDEDALSCLQRLLGTPDDRFIAVPLVVGGAVTGLLVVAMGQAATDADEWLLSALADQAAVALENARLGGEVRLEMEARLSASEGATSAKDRALATLAHDIRSPLGAIEAYCELLEDEIYGPVNDRQREAIGRVRMSGRHLLSLLDNVMDMARLNAGVVRVAAVPVNLTQASREAIDMLLPAADAKLQILQLGRRDDVIVTGDHGHVRQIVVNLIGNAIKFTPEGGRIVLSTAFEGEADLRRGVIRVRDSGPGIPEEERVAILEPFYRSERTSKAAGVGLGLAICKSLIEQMSGELEVESELGAGSTFIVRLPVAGAADEA